MTRILFAEDDTNLGLLLKENLQHKGYDTVWCRDGAEAFERFTKETFNLCLLDVMLPVADGFTLAKQIRTVNASIPIIFLTARGMHEDKVKGFETGCDDYVTKPFNTQELCLRISAILKRLQQNNGTSQKTFDLGKFCFDYTKMALQIGKESRKLSSKESDLLYMLVTNKNEFVPRNVILEKIWGNDDYFSAKSMDVYISKIRKHLKDDPSVEILNAYGIGFKMIVHE
jgi:DNA-binding response OmpR family regulator